jgi:hypothetical protein
MHCIKLSSFVACSIGGTKFSIVFKDDSRVEVSFFRPYDPNGAGIPINIDKR